MKCPFTIPSALFFLFRTLPYDSRLFRATSIYLCAGFFKGVEKGISCLGLLIDVFRILSNAMIVFLRQKALSSRSSRLEVLYKKDVLKSFARVSFLIKERLAQVFSSQFCEIFRNLVFYRAPLVAAFDRRSLLRI